MLYIFGISYENAILDVMFKDAIPSLVKAMNLKLVQRWRPDWNVSVAHHKIYMKLADKKTRAFLREIDDRVDRIYD